MCEPHRLWDGATQCAVTARKSRCMRERSEASKDGRGQQEDSVTEAEDIGRGAGICISSSVAAVIPFQECCAVFYEVAMTDGQAYNQ